MIVEDDLSRQIDMDGANYPCQNLKQKPLQ